MSEVLQSSEPSRLSNVLVAASMRADQWRQLNATARAWSFAAGGPNAKGLHANCQSQFNTVLLIEHCWAYPGERLLGEVREALDRGDAALFARLVHKISAAILSGDYRRDERVWDSGDDLDATALDALPPDITGINEKPYFEVLVVTPSDPAQWQRSKDEMRRLRRPDDAFHYAVVHAGSFEDAALAVMVNNDLQAVVLMDGFGFASRHDVADLKEFLSRHIHVDHSDLEPGSLALTLARTIDSFRPELDLYLLTDRAPESLAGSDAAAVLRRVFHYVEEPMEIHLSILDGVNDRYLTPYFLRLSKYGVR